jgi:site-specific recombinase XerD
MDTNFRKANKQDIVKLVAKINNNSDFKDWTKYNYLVILRRFYKWLRQSDEYPKEVKWIHPRIKQHKKTMPKELLTFDDVKNMANATNNLRDRCFILVLYETGARIGEIFGLKISDVEFDKYGAKLNLVGKTGPRKIRVISSAPAISNWLNQHPKKENGNLLFCGIGNYKKGTRLEYQSFRKVLRETAKKIDLQKPVNPHHFRHSRATDLAKKLTEAQLCQYMGWKIGSEEAATYVHLHGRDIDDKILALHGLKEEEKTEDLMKPILCPRCGIKNDAASKFCMECSLGLDEKSIMEYDKQKEEATNLGMILKKAKDKNEIKEMLKPLLIEILKESDIKK